MYNIRFTEEKYNIRFTEEKDVDFDYVYILGTIQCYMIDFQKIREVKKGE